MSDYETILVEREGRVARVSFNRPDKLNSFNGTMRREFLVSADASRRGRCVEGSARLPRGRTGIAGEY